MKAKRENKYQFISLLLDVSTPVFILMYIFLFLYSFMWVFIKIFITEQEKTLLICHDVDLICVPPIRKKRVYAARIAVYWLFSSLSFERKFLPTITR